MTKTFLKSILLGLGLLFVAPFVFASTIDFTPTTVNVEANKNFTVQVYVNPQSATYSTKLELKFPADLLQVTSFTLNDSWMALKQAGYDATDNVNGVLLKTGGFPGGFSTKTLFGSVTFSAVKAGTANITVGTNTNIPNASNANTLTASSPVVVTITAPAAPKPTEPTQPQTTPQTTTPKTTVKPQTVAQQPTETTQPETSQQPQEVAQTPAVNTTAAQASIASVIGNIVTLGTNNFLVGFLVIVIALIVLYFVYQFFKNKKPKIQN
jgi:hypothetical protein